MNILALSVDLVDQEAEAIFAPVSGHAHLEVLVVGHDSLPYMFDDLVLGLLELVLQAAGSVPCLDRRFDEVIEVGLHVSNGVGPGHLLDQAEPASGFSKGDWLGKVGDVLQDLLAGFYPIGGHPEPGELHLHLIDLELLLVECYPIVPTELEIVEDVIEIPGDGVIVQECVIHHLALVLDILGDVFCPPGVCIA